MLAGSGSPDDAESELPCIVEAVEEAEGAAPRLGIAKQRSSKRNSWVGDYAKDVFTMGIWRATYDHFYRRGWFWILTTVLVLMEPVLCSYNPERTAIFWLQVAVLILSTACFGVQLVGHVAYKHLIENKTKGESTHFAKLQEVRQIIFTGAFVLEFFCLLCGWIFIFSRPGIAILRCFRVFRILYYHELPKAVEGLEEKGVLEAVKEALAWLLYLFGGEKTTELVLKVCKFASNCLQNMAQEMFFLTEQTRGGFILMVMLFYSAYVVGCSMWVESEYVIAVPSTACNTLGGCVFTMLRLTFYDGSGLDFLWALSADNKFLFAIVVVYLCSTAFGILNGLIGIFGDIFNDNSNRTFLEPGKGTRDRDIVAMNDEISALLTEFKSINAQLADVSTRVATLSSSS